MKKSIYLFSLILLASCSSVRFEDPQPVGSKELKNIPSKFIGNYVTTDGDSLSIFKTYFIYDDVYKLSDKGVVLKKANGFYVLSTVDTLKDEGTNLITWDVTLIKQVADSLVAYKLDAGSDKDRKEPANITRLKNILQVKEIPGEKDDDNYFLIGPDKKKFKEILKQNFFTPAKKFGRIKGKTR